MRFEHAYLPYGAYWSTPFTKWQGSLSGIHTVDLAARSDPNSVGLARSNRLELEMAVERANESVGVGRLVPVVTATADDGYQCREHEHASEDPHAATVGDHLGGMRMPPSTRIVSAFM